MDFIERWFGVSPDGGDGSLELLYIVTVVAVVVMFLFRKQLYNLMSNSRNDRAR